MSNNPKPVILTKDEEQIFPLTDASLVTGLADVATSGDYDDLLNKPTIPSGVVVDQTYDATSQNAQSGVAMAGALACKQDTIDATHKLSYNLLSDTPTIPTVPVISTDIATDATSDTKTTSPKAVKTFVEGKGYTTNTGTVTGVTIGSTPYTPSNGIVTIPAYPSVPVTDVTVGGTSVINNGTAVIPAIPNVPVTDVTVGGVSVLNNGTATVPAIPTVPVISTNVVTDKNSDVKTSSPKSVYSEIYPATVSSQPSGGMLPNVLYKLGTLSGSVTLTMASASDNTIENEWKFTFTADSTAPTITWPAAITNWLGNCVENGVPVILASKHYEVSVEDGYAFIGEF